MKLERRNVPKSFITWLLEKFFFYVLENSLYDMPHFSKHVIGFSIYPSFVALISEPKNITKRKHNWFIIYELRENLNF